MENVRSRSSTVAAARFLLIALSLLRSLLSLILRRQQNAFDLDGFRCKDIVKWPRRKTCHLGSCLAAKVAVAEQVHKYWQSHWHVAVVLAGNFTFRVVLCRVEDAP
jgi:hypothetical protein